MSSDTEPGEATRPRVESLPPPPPHRRRVGRVLIAGVAVVAILAVGIAIGGLVMQHSGGASFASTQALLQPTEIAQVKDWSTVAIKGQVAEIFGNKFILQDGSGRALVETGRAGEDGDLVKKDEAVTVAGRFEHGFLHAQVIVTGDGKTVEIGPPGPPPPPGGPFAWLRHLRVEADGPAMLPTPAT